MPLDRRGFLAWLAACAAFPGRATDKPASATAVGQALPQLLPNGKNRRVVIVGGGWGGLSVARHLRALAPELEVVLLERSARFWSGPLSNKWLAGLVDSRYVVHDPAPAALAHGYRRIHADVTAVERDRRRVVTAQGTLAFDWLVLAVGIRYDYRPWFGADRQAADYARERYPCAYLPGEELPLLKRKLDGFAGGDLLMTLPPLPYRCPPSAYERAALIGWLLKTRRIKGRLIVLDPNPGIPAFRRVFEERYREQILYVSDVQVKSVDPYGRRVVTEFDEYRFDDAILMAPQQAGDLLWQADLIGRDGAGRPTGWADQEPFRLHARADERVFLLGDALGAVSPLFGHYPKTGHMANRQARIVAGEIAAQAAGETAPLLLPESLCHVFPDFDPPRTIRIDTRYRVRGDGLIEQSTRQIADPNPRDEDLAWAAGLFEEFLAFRR